MARAHVRRELPSTLVVDVVEREAACACRFGALYLADADGNVFKRATPDEAAGLPVVTGIGRDDYLADPDGARDAAAPGAGGDRRLAAGGGPPAIGEVHLDRIAGVTLYTVERGVGVRLGAATTILAGAAAARSTRCAAALATSGEQAAADLRRQPRAARPRDRQTGARAGAQAAESDQTEVDSDPVERDA